MVDGAPPPDKRVTKPVAAILVEQGFARQDRNRLNILPAGRAALNAPQPHEPVYLRERDGLTTRRALSVRDEPEVQDTTDLRAHWRDDADARKADTEDRRGQARRLSRATRRTA